MLFQYKSVSPVLSYIKSPIELKNIIAMAINTNITTRNQSIHGVGAPSSDVPPNIGITTHPHGRSSLNHQG
jgi:hypothetical protein